MKIRNGFVSNSSSSSFCIYGAVLDGRPEMNVEFFSKIKKEFPKQYDDGLNKLIDTYTKNINDWNKDRIPILEALKSVDNPEVFADKKTNGCEHSFDRNSAKFCPECGKQAFIVKENELKKKIRSSFDLDFVSSLLSIEFNYMYDSIYVGRSWNSIGDDETGGQLKKGVENLVKKLFGITKCSSIEQAWQDG